MMKIRKKSHILIIFTLILSLFSLNIAFAFDTKGNANNPKLTIHKYEQEPGSTQSNGTGLPGQTAQGTPLAGVEFTLTQTHSYDPATNKWTEVTGAPTKYVTDSNGLIEINNIPLGRYKVQETDGPAHVNLNTDEYYVDIPMTNASGDEVNYDVHIYPKNETIRGAVELRKLDGEQTGTVGLAGVVFALYDSQDNLINGNLITDSDGYIRVDGLAYGDYYFKEISAPQDYVIFGDKKPFSITQSGTVAVDGTKTGKVETVEFTNYKAPAIEKTINGSTETLETNRETEFTYNLKIALPEDIASYDEFIVSDILDSRLTYTGNWNVEGAPQSVFTFNQNGQTLTWEVNDFAALDGIKFVTINFTAEINAGVPVQPIPNNANIDFTNNSGTGGKKTPKPVIVIPTEGSIKIIKQDGDTSNKLAGAEFELRDLNGNVVQTGTTNASGEIEWTGLDYGDYKLVETKAPSGYRILTNPIEIKINKNNQDIILTVDNYENGWLLPKTGGFGTIIFTLSGVLLMVIAAFMYIRGKKLQNSTR